MTPDISIIVTVYNTSPYLGKCLDSILAQNFSNFELIAVDNQSTDDSSKILKAYEKKDKRIKYHLMEHHGRACDARREGLNLATGDYITYVDSDDSIKPGMYTELYEQIRKTNADVAVCNYDVEYPDRKAPSYSAMTDEVISIDEMGYENYFFKYFCMARPNNYLWTRLFKRSIIIENDLTIHSVDISEDTIFTMFFTMMSKKVVHISRSYYRYFQRENSTVRETIHRVNIANSFVYAFDTVCRYAEKMDLRIGYILPLYAFTRMRSVIFYSMQSGLEEENAFISLKSAIRGNPIKDYLAKVLSAGYLEKYGRAQRLSCEELEDIRIFIRKCLN